MTFLIKIVLFILLIGLNSHASFIRRVPLHGCLIIKRTTVFRANFVTFYPEKVSARLRLLEIYPIAQGTYVHSDSIGGPRGTLAN